MNIGTCKELDFPHSAIWCKTCYRESMESELRAVSELQLAQTKRLADAVESLVEDRDEDEDKPKPKPKPSPQPVQAPAPSDTPKYTWKQ